MDIIIEKGLAQLRNIPYFPVIQSKSKYELIDIMLTVIGVAFEEVSKRVPELKGEIAGWNEGRGRSAAAWVARSFEPRREKLF